MLPNRPTRPWLETNRPSLHQTQGSSHNTTAAAEIMATTAITRPIRRDESRAHTYSPTPNDRLQNQGLMASWHFTGLIRSDAEDGMVIIEAHLTHTAT